MHELLELFPVTPQKSFDKCAVSEILKAQQLEGVYNSLQPNKNK